MPARCCVELLTTVGCLHNGIRVGGRCGVGLIFFFQAEDGIRDLVRSRGLGDVYKRQAMVTALSVTTPMCTWAARSTCCSASLTTCDMTATVSYTHLTLPTSDLV